MAYDKAVDSEKLEQGLTKVADAIRDKTGDADALSFPDGMVESLTGASAAKLFRQNMISYCKQQGYPLYTIKDGTTTLKRCGSWEYRRYWVTMPDSVTEIVYDGYGCFEGCQNVLFDKLSNNLTFIGNNAFHCCSNLALTSLPEGLTSIGDYAFHYCSNLALTSLPEGLTFIGNNAFQYCSNLALTSLPEGLTSIGGYAFQYCSNLALTSLPEGLTSIGNNAFQYCSNLALTSLPEGLTSIGDYAFHYANYMQITEIPASVKSIGGYALHKAFSSSSLLGFKGTLTFKGKPDSIAAKVFGNNSALKAINVPWSEGEVANAPWGFDGTINYNYTGG